MKGKEVAGAVLNADCNGAILFLVLSLVLGRRSGKTQADGESDVQPSGWLPLSDGIL